MENAALIIIDMQHAYFTKGYLAEQRSKLTQACNELISIAANYNVPIFALRTEHASDKSTWTLNMLENDKAFLLSGDAQTRSLSELKLDQAHHIIKTRDSGFFGTDLHRSLQQQQIDTLIVSGVSTHMCIAQTATDAYNHNYHVILATDAIASHNPDWHQPILAMLHEEYRQPNLSNKQIMEKFTRE